MINIKIGKREGQFRAVTSGHANFNPGADPVCAAVSAIMFSVMGGIENLTDGGKRKFFVTPGQFDLRYKPNNAADDATAAVIFNTAIIGLLQIQAAYPDNVFVDK